MLQIFELSLESTLWRSTDLHLLEMICYGSFSLSALPKMTRGNKVNDMQVEL